MRHCVSYKDLDAEIHSVTHPTKVRDLGAREYVTVDK